LNYTILLQNQDGQVILDVKIRSDAAAKDIKEKLFKDQEEN